MSWFKLESVILFLKILISVVLSRNFGNIIHDIAQNYIDINVSDLRKLEKLHIKRNKAQLDINFLINCKNFGVFPKFINVYLPNVDEKDMDGIKKNSDKMQYINGFEKEMTLTRRLETWNYKLNIN